ncbi:enamine deaminase RidA (YjgF/YER057c/UK114 family) [Arthrobacter sp. 1088]|uniref:RidA family protein n=1 Tax=Arthrobacter sp. 1088 TaxID=2817768 RepID=UPI002855F760|nr:RidA family protein [Arthrobacter sp. 1088]MDR6688919.1 enamine deaminase RidA (YjgF/YER057c/UK114 family) [Arthrobacter sp. 1088]
MQATTPTATVRRYPQHPTPGQLSSSVSGAGNILVTTQVPIGTDGEVVPGGIEQQSRQVLQNLQTELAAAGSDLQRVLHLTIYLVSMDDRPAFNAAYSRFFSPPFPVRAAVGVRELARPDMLIEVTAIAAA